MAIRVSLHAFRLVVPLTTLAIAIGLLPGGGPQVARGHEEIVITCQECEASPTDVFSQSWYDVVQAFNRAYKGTYRVDVQHYGGTANDLQYWEREALAGALPDIFIAQSTQLQTLSKTGKLLNLAPYLAKDAAWKSSFYPDSFQSLSGPDGQIWGIAEERDVLGI